MSFEAAGSAVAEPPAYYDAIFAMAVFRHGRLGDRPPRCDHLIKFGDFERSVGELAASLKPGGLLILRHANFRFGDTVASVAFTPICGAASHPDAAQTPLYGPDDQLLPDGQRDDGVFEQRVVTLGASNDKVVEVKQGLKSGEAVSLAATHDRSQRLLARRGILRPSSAPALDRRDNRRIGSRRLGGVFC